MIEADKVRFAEIMNGLASLPGGNGQLTREQLRLWWNAMSHWSIDDFNSAANHLFRTSEYMPKPFDFEQLRKASRITAHEGWPIALKASSSWRDSNSCGDALIDRVVASIGGYRSIAMADTERDLPHVQRRFLEAFEQIDDVESVREALPQIAPRPALARLIGDVLPALPSKSAQKLLSHDEGRPALYVDAMEIIERRRRANDPVSMDDLAILLCASVDELIAAGVPPQ